MDFMGLGFAASATLCGRDVAPKESFTRFQLAAIIDSSIHRIWRLGWLDGWDFDDFD